MRDRISPIELIFVVFGYALAALWAVPALIRAQNNWATAAGAILSVLWVYSFIVDAMRLQAWTKDNEKSFIELNEKIDKIKRKKK